MFFSINYVAFITLKKYLKILHKTIGKRDRNSLKKLKVQFTIKNRAQQPKSKIC